MKYSVVIPVYNTTHSLKELVARIEKVFMDEIKDSYEIIFIDDCSTNTETWPTLVELKRNHPQVNVIQLMRNFGKAGAVLCGLNQASGKYTITMDDDLQHRPEDIVHLIDNEEHDVVIGTFAQKKHSWFKKIGSNIVNWFDYKLLGKPKHIRNSPFKLINSGVVEAMKAIKTPYPFISGLIFYTTKDIIMTEVSHDSRKFEKSNFSFRKRMKQFSNLLINNSSFLLQVIASIGIIMSFISFLLGFYYVIKKVTVGTAVSGWTSMIVILLIIGGLMLFSIGVVGEYLIRIINGVEHKPPYVIRKILTD